MYNLLNNKCSFSFTDNTINIKSESKIGEIKYKNFDDVTGIKTWENHFKNRDTSELITFYNNLHTLKKVCSENQNETTKKMQEVVQSVLSEVEKKVPMMRKYLQQENSTPIKLKDFSFAFYIINSISRVQFSQAHVNLLLKNSDRQILINQLKQIECDIQKVTKIIKNTEDTPFYGPWSVENDFNNFLKTLQPLANIPKSEVINRLPLNHILNKINDYTGKLIHNSLENEFLKTLKKELQETYKKEYMNTVQKAYNMIQSDLPFAMILDFIAEQREMIAIKVYNIPAQDHGKLRTIETRYEITPLRGKYSSYLERVKQAIGNKKKFKGYQIFDGQIRDFENQFYGITVNGTIGNEEIPLTRFVMTNNVPRNSKIVTALNFQGHGRDHDNPYATFLHTEVKNIPKGLKHVTKLFENIRESELSTENLLKEMAKIHWWMSHLMPYRRGSAAITEMLVKAMFLTKGYRVEWKPQLDVEALCTTKMDQFIKNYPNLVKIVKTDMDIRSDS